MSKSELMISLGAALSIRDTADKLLFEKKKVGDKVMTIERELPFRLKYRLEKNLSQIDRDVKLFNEQRMALLTAYGDVDGNKVVINSQENMEKFQQDLSYLLTYKIPHSITRLDPEDIEALKENINISYEDLKIFIAYMMDEPELFENLALNFNVDYSNFEESTNKEETSEEIAND